MRALLCCIMKEMEIIQRDWKSRYLKLTFLGNGIIPIIDCDLWYLTSIKIQTSQTLTAWMRYIAKPDLSGTNRRRVAGVDKDHVKPDIRHHLPWDGLRIKGFVLWNKHFSLPPSNSPSSSACVAAQALSLRLRSVRLGGNDSLFMCCS